MKYDFSVYAESEYTSIVYSTNLCIYVVNIPSERVTYNIIKNETLAL